MPRLVLEQLLQLVLELVKQVELPLQEGEQVEVQLLPLQEVVVGYWQGFKSLNILQLDQGYCNWLVKQDEFELCQIPSQQFGQP